MRRYHSELPKSEKQALLKDYRDIKIGTPEKFFPNNRISTTKYTVYTFFFKNMFEQLSKIANIYFVFLSILQCIPNVTTSNGIPTYLPPLLTIMILTMIKDGYEDYKRYKSDEEENNKKTLAWRDGNFTQIQWRDVMVGDVLKVEKDNFFPADMMIMGSSLYKKGQCFIETKNLDGETNLKSKFVIEDLKNYLQSDQQALSMIGQKINAEGPNHYLSKFKGTLELGQNKFPLSANNFLLRGCMLRNTEYIFGCVVYTG